MKLNLEYNLRDLFIMSVGLAKEAGEVLGLLKKSVRDGNLDLQKLKKKLGDVGYYWVKLCQEHGFLPSEILDANIEKLNGRLARGTLKRHR